MGEEGLGGEIPFVPSECGRQTPAAKAERVWRIEPHGTGSIGPPTALRKGDVMGLVVLLLVLALLFGGVGLAANALWWMLIIAAALVIASAFARIRSSQDLVAPTY